MNTSMFLPQVAENDVYDANGDQVDDINSVFEYFAVMFGFDETPDDEDNDNGQNFHLVKLVDFNLGQPFVTLDKFVFSEIKINKYSDYVTSKLERISYETVTPPPEV